MEDARFAELISRIAHELRSPLTSVKGFSSTLVNRWDKFTDAQRFQFVETIHVDAERMARIVSEVLDLARLEAGKLELYPQVTDVDQVVSRVVHQLRQVQGAERIELRIEPDCRAWVDPSRLEGLLFSLIENAIKYSETGPICITATKSEGKIDLVVTDKGVGIDSSRLPEIFEGPGPSGQHAAPSGTGLGLLLAKKIVEASGGTISAGSSPSTGSTFSVRLPSEGPDAHSG